MSQEVKALLLGISAGFASSGVLGLAINIGNVATWVCLVASAVVLFTIKFIEAYYNER
jgi:hypothetical protein